MAIDDCHHSFAELAQTDELELTYAHMSSIRNFGVILNRSVGQDDASEPAEPSAEPAGAEE